MPLVRSPARLASSAGCGWWLPLSTTHHAMTWLNWRTQCAIELESGVVVLAGGQDGRIPLVAEVTRDLTDRLHAGSLVKEIGARAGGGGGGNRPDFATGQGTDPAKLGTALQHTFTLVEQALQPPS